VTLSIAYLAGSYKSFSMPYRKSFSIALVACSLLLDSEEFGKFSLQRKGLELLSLHLLSCLS
jgi:hypothetical protein